MELVTKLWNAPYFIRLTWLLCLLGVACNILLLVRDVSAASILWRLHAGFLILYVGQVVFILTQEKFVAVLTFLQGLAALFTTADFIFTPLVQAVGMVYWLSNPPVDTRSAYMYIFVSVAFTLQMACAAYLWFYFRAQEKTAENTPAA